MHEPKCEEDKNPKPVLIYFEGCPNAEKAKALLRNSGVPFVAEVQDSLPQNHAHLGYSSPTLLYIDQLIFGTKVNGLAKSCSVNLPEASEVLRRLSGLGFSSGHESR